MGAGLTERQAADAEAANRERVVSDLDALIAALPNGTPCIGCGGTGRRDTMSAIGRWIRGDPPDPADQEPCPACNATGARHCDMGCGRMGDRWSLDRGYLLCALCDHDTRAPAPCAVCGDADGAVVDIGFNASVMIGLWCIPCGAFCCSDECADTHEKGCPGLARRTA